MKFLTLRDGNWKRFICRFLEHKPWDPPGSERSECRRCGEQFPNWTKRDMVAFIPLFGPEARSARPEGGT